MANIPLPFNTWSAIPVSGTGGTATLTNPDATHPIYVKVSVSGVVVSIFKVLAGASGVPIAYPASATFQANPTAAITVGVT